MTKRRLALLDLYNGIPNQGMRCLHQILSKYGKFIDYEVFDVRQKCELPGLDFDIFICSGGPGNPLEGDGKWDKKFYKLVDRAWQHNLKTKDPNNRKFFFFICHSFQMACNHFGLGEITKRKSTSFGVFPVHKTADGYSDPLLDGLADPFYAVDSRDWQLVQPDLEVFSKHGASILALEKIRTHVEYERAIMAVRFSDEFVGTQFHPEADAEGMKEHFSKEENRQKVIENFSQSKYENMMLHLDDPDKIYLTHSSIIPHFIERSLEKLDSLAPIPLSYDLNV